MARLSGNKRAGLLRDGQGDEWAAMLRARVRGRPGTRAVEVEQLPQRWRVGSPDGSDSVMGLLAAKKQPS